MRTLIISHASCVDGFLSAYLMNLVYPYNEIIYAKYQQELDYSIISKEQWNKICIVDFSFPKEELEKLSQYTKEIELIDHHDSAVRRYGNETESYLGNKLVKFCLCEDYCASKLIWDKYFTFPYGQYLPHETYVPTYVNDLGNYPYLNLKRIVQYVDDYDRWVLEFPYVFEVNEIIRQIFSNNQNNSFDQLHHFIEQFEVGDFNTDYFCSNKDLCANIERALKIVKDRDSVIAHLSENPQIFKFQEYEVPFIPCKSNLVNYVGHSLSEQYPFVFMYDIIPSKQKVKISLRAKKFSEVNVAKLAELYGGGGHPSAAGILIDLCTFNEIIQNGTIEQNQ